MFFVHDRSLTLRTERVVTTKSDREALKLTNMLLEYSRYRGREDL